MLRKRNASSHMSYTKSSRDIPSPLDTPGPFTPEETRQRKSYAEVIIFEATDNSNISPSGHDTTVFLPLASMTPDYSPKKFMTPRDCVPSDRLGRSTPPPLPRSPNTSTVPSPQRRRHTHREKYTSPPPDKKLNLHQHQHYLPILIALPPSLVW